MEEFIGTIKAFAFNFTPRGWLACNGAILPISSHTTLFSLIGTTYGGDGRTTFQLPDLRGRTAINQGQHPGSAYNWRMGQQAGLENYVLSQAQMPIHSHEVVLTNQNISAKIGIPAVNDDGTLEETENNILANSANSYAPASSADTILSSFDATVGGTAMSGNAGGSQSINNIQPSLVINYCICEIGIYPPRN